MLFVFTLCAFYLFLVPIVATLREGPERQLGTEAACRSHGGSCSPGGRGGAAAAPEAEENRCRRGRGVHGIAALRSLRA